MRTFGWSQQLLVAALVAVLVATRTTAKPCPHNAIFTFSDVHGQSHCVCSHGLECKGSQCTHGGPSNLPSYQSHHAGFPATCADCMCHDPALPPTSTFSHRNDENTTSQVSVHGVYDHPDLLFDDVCHVLPDVTPPAPQALRAANWVHIPKCGTSLTSLLYNYACQSTPLSKMSTLSESEVQGRYPTWFRTYSAETCGYCWKTCEVYPRCTAFTQWAPHDGLLREPSRPFRLKHCAARLIGNVPGHTPLTFEPEFKGTYVGTFRDPRRRLLSAFNYGRHAIGCPRQQKRKLKKIQSLKEFAEYPGIASCQVKMLMGYKCAQQGIVVDNSMLEEAKRRLREEFAFIGITEYWKASVCLFHRMYGGNLHPDSLRNLRPTTDFFQSLEKEGYTFVPSDEWTRLSVDVDHYDWELYRTARSLFVSSLKKYGIELPSALIEELRRDGEL